jgi:hypothetical protein
MWAVSWYSVVVLVVHDSNVIRAYAHAAIGRVQMLSPGVGWGMASMRTATVVLDVLRDETRRQQSQVKLDGRLWL